MTPPSPSPPRVPGHYWIARTSKPNTVLPGEWLGSQYWMCGGQAARDDEVTVHSERLDPPQVGGPNQAAWINAPVIAAMTALKEALTEAQNAVRLEIATGGMGGPDFANAVARREQTEKALAALEAVMAARAS